MGEGRGEISGEEGLALSAALSLEPNKEKHVPLIMGQRKQLCALREGDRFRTLRDAVTIDRIDWNSAATSSEGAKDSLRIFASPIDVRVLLYPRRSSVRLTFPDDIGKLGLLDLQHGVVLVMFGEFTEFWNPSDWRTFLETKAEMQESALDTIDSLTED